mmetsp:Transcript_58462/g.136628  ORF Transcript_58462/g.136628 Transcript_58462/m.136628 type:complete len:203 (+) Transcript_58462:530-1138(+)
MPKRSSSSRPEDSLAFSSISAFNLSASRSSEASARQPRMVRRPGLCCTNMLAVLLVSVSTRPLPRFRNSVLRVSAPTPAMPRILCASSPKRISAGDSSFLSEHPSSLSSHAARCFSLLASELALMGSAAGGTSWALASWPSTSGTSRLLPDLALVLNVVLAFGGFCSVFCLWRSRRPLGFFRTACKLSKRSSNDTPSPNANR